MANVLVAEDDPILRKLNTQILSRAGYQTTAVADGRAAWEALSTNAFDLLITDNDMPNLTGMQLVAKLRLNKIRLPILSAAQNINGSISPPAWKSPLLPTICSKLLRAFSTPIPPCKRQSHASAIQFLSPCAARTLVAPKDRKGGSLSFSLYFVPIVHRQNAIVLRVIPGKRASGDRTRRKLSPFVSCPSW